VDAPEGFGPVRKTEWLVVCTDTSDEVVWTQGTRPGQVVSKGHVGGIEKNGGGGATEELAPFRRTANGLKL